MGWLTAGGWLSAALTAALLGWLWERAKRARDNAKAEAEALKGQNIRLAGQLGSMAATAKQQITRLEESNDVLRTHFKSALQGMEALALAHPDVAGELLRRVFTDAAKAGATDDSEHPGLSARPTPKLPGTDN